MEKKIKKRWSHVWRGEWRASRNGGWEWEFGGVWKMKAHIEVPLELVFCPKPPNFGVEAHIEVPTGVSLSFPKLEMRPRLFGLGLGSIVLQSLLDLIATIWWISNKSSSTLT
jgi:hypothetical protein